MNAFQRVGLAAGLVLAHAAAGAALVADINALSPTNVSLGGAQVNCCGASANTVAAVVDASVAGQLSRVDLQLGAASAGHSVTMHLMPTAANGQPLADLASAYASYTVGVPPWTGLPASTQYGIVSIDVTSANLLLDVGEDYAVVLTNTTPFASNVVGWAASTAPSARLAAFDRGGTNPGWDACVLGLGCGPDVALRTFVETSPTAAVPEPASLVLVGMALLAAFAATRRSRRSTGLGRLLAAGLLTVPALASATVSVSLRQGNWSDSIISEQSAAMRAAADPPGGGNSGGLVHGSANGNTGVLKAYADTPLNWGVTQATASLYDTVSFMNRGTQAVTVTLHAWFNGHVEKDAHHVNTLAFGHLRLEANQSFSAAMLSTRGCPPQTPSFTCTWGDPANVSMPLSLTFLLQPGVNQVAVAAHLSVHAAQGATASFENSAHLWLDLPASVSFTSNTPNFLAYATPVPEPAPAALALAGLAAVCWRVRRAKASQQRTQPQRV